MFLYLQFYKKQAMLFYSTLDAFEKDGDSAMKFIALLQTKWDEAHDMPNVFRYKISNIKERMVDDKYLLQLNPDRATNRRTPELISDMNQPFDDMKFNFTKVSQDEVLFSFGRSINDPELHSFIVNVSPISRYHTLFCPFINKKLPQVLTEESLYLAIQVMFISKNSNLKLGFNSLCAMASVNHLHFHMFMECHELPVQKAERCNMEPNIMCLQDYPVEAFCFIIKKNSYKQDIKEMNSHIKLLQANNIAHNIFFTLKPELDVVEVFLFPRKSTSGVKQLDAFNVAVLELSGWFPVFSKEAFGKLNSEDLERELRKWKFDNFNNLLCTLYRQEFDLTATRAASRNLS